jgi:hypothetical protein
MTTFTKATATRPPRVIVVPRAAFSDRWEGKPSGDVAVGLQLLSDGDYQTARAEATKLASELQDDEAGWLEAFHDALLRWAVAKAATDPNDARKPYFQAAEDTVRDALTPLGVRRVYDELERLTIETSPLEPEANDGELLELAELLKHGAGVLTPLVRGQERSVRRLLRHCLEVLREAAR